MITFDDFYDEKMTWFPKCSGFAEEDVEKSWKSFPFIHHSGWICDAFGLETVQKRSVGADLYCISVTSYTRLFHASKLCVLPGCHLCYLLWRVWWASVFPFPEIQGNDLPWWLCHRLYNNVLFFLKFIFGVSGSQALLPAWFHAWRLHQSDLLYYIRRRSGNFNEVIYRSGVCRSWLVPYLMMIFNQRNTTTELLLFYLWFYNCFEEVCGVPGS